MFLRALEKKNVSFQGDFNLHLPHETELIYDSGFFDIWWEQRGEEKGYTFDPKTNPLMKLYLPFDNRRMRLDRMILHQESQNLEPKDVKIWANERIGCSLAPSDHYGMAVTIEVNQEVKRSLRSFSIEKDLVQKAIEPYRTGFRTP